MPIRRRLLFALLLPAVAALTLASSAAAIAADHPPLGAYTQLPGAAGCAGAPGADDGCTPVTGMDDTWRVAASDDGRHVYALTMGAGGHALVGLAADPRHGGLRPLGPGGCLSAHQPGCTPAPELWSILGFALAPDGRHLYIAGQSAADAPVTVTSWARDAATGTLARVPGAAGCVTAGAATADCRHVDGLENAAQLTVSPDGTSVYVVGSSFAADDGRLATLARDPADGRLTQPSPTGCLIAATPVPSGCRAARALAGASDVVVSPDGRSVYVGGGTETAGTIAVFVRGAQGGLTQPAGTDGCVRGGAAPGDCAGARGMNPALYRAFPAPLAISPDGATLYKAASGPAGGIAVFARHAATGALTQLAGRDGCLADGPATSDCAGGIGLGSLWGIAAAPTGDTLLAASYNGFGGNGDVAVLTRGGTGALTQRAEPFGCLSSWPDPRCLQTRSPVRSAHVAFSPGGDVAYVGGWDSSLSNPAPLVVLTRETPPVCAAATARAVAGVATELALDCYEPNGQPLTRSIVTWPAHGTLRAVDEASGRFSYTPDGGFSGEDEIAFRAADGAYESAVARVTVTVTAPERDPGRGGESDPRSEPDRRTEPDRRIEPRAETPRTEQRLTLLPIRGALRADARGRVKLRLRCEATPGAACRGTLTLRTARKVRPKPRGRARIVTLGRARVSVPRGRTATVTVTLSKPARTLLRRAGRVATSATTGSATTRLTLKQPRRR